MNIITLYFLIKIILGAISTLACLFLAWRALRRLNRVHAEYEVIDDDKKELQESTSKMLPEHKG